MSGSKVDPSDRPRSTPDGPRVDNDHQAVEGRTVSRRLFPAIGAFVLAASLVSAHIVAYPTISVFDEGVHFDYVLKASSGHLVRKGDRIGQETMREMACRRIDQIDWVYPACSDMSRYSPRAFPAEGYNNADIHPPTYHFLTGMLSRVLTGVGLVSNRLTAARYVGILWLGLGLLTLWYTGRELHIGGLPLGLLLLLVAANPWVLHASSTVNNDAVSLWAGGSVMLATLRWESGKWPIWSLALVAFVVPLFKTTNVIAVGLCVIYLALRKWNVSRRRADPKRRAPGRALTVLLGSAIIATGTWVAIRSTLSRPVITPLDVWFPPTDAPLEHISAQLTALVTPISQRLPSAVLGERVITALGATFGILIIAACLWPLLRGFWRTRRNALAAAGGFAMLTGGLLFATTNFILFRASFGVSPRYGLSLVPALGLAVAGALRWRGALVGVGILAGLTLTVTALTLAARI